MSFKIGYLVHDLNDPAVARRVSAFHAGGAAVRIAGFYRRQPVEDVCGAPAVAIGRSADAKLAHRAALVLGNLATSRAAKHLGCWSDIIVARNLEALALALRFRSRGQPIVYECLDVHRIMFRDDLVGRGVRGLERALLSRCRQVLTSSPAYERSYFRAMQDFKGPVLLVENKPLGQRIATRSEGRSTDGPWRIGWFGMLRCSKSLKMLQEISDAAGGAIEVILAGIPARTELKDFEARIEAAKYLRYVGPYDAAALPALYGTVDFSWCVDFFEEGMNSDWLLPNRLYESLAYGAVPIALRNVEVGRWLGRQGVGLLFENLEKEVLDRLVQLSPGHFAKLEADVREVPESSLFFTPAECKRLVQALGGLQ